jgi:hypothetical protein
MGRWPTSFPPPLCGPIRCGTGPAETASSEPENFERTDLKDRLPAAEYAAIHKAWFERHGSDPHPLADILGFDPDSGVKARAKETDRSTDLMNRLRRWFRR